MEVRYSILAKLEPLCLFCRDKIRSLNMKDNGPLVSFTDCFQGLEITEKKICGNYGPEYQLVIQMVEHIEYTLFSGT